MQKNVTTSGTPVQLTSTAVPDGVTVVVKAKSGNTGTITLGYSSATALNSGTDCFKLTAGQAIGIQVDDTSHIWLDSTINGEGVEVILEKNA